MLVIVYYFGIHYSFFRSNFYLQGFYQGFYELYHCKLERLMQTDLVTVNNLHFSRANKVIFSGVNLTLRQGKITALLGPSGTGKTTLLHLLGGQLQPASGSVQVFGQEVPQLGRSELFKLRSRMGVLFQSGALFTDMSVYDNVAFPLRVNTPLPESMIRDLVFIKLEAVGLRGARDLMPAQLSGGMARRVALARAIALDPELLMYDEPFAGQDPISMGVLVQLVKRLNQALGLTSVIVSHDLQETLSIADYAYILAGGKVIAEGTPAELAASTQENVRQFMGGLPDGPVAFNYPANSFATDLFAADLFAADSFTKKEIPHA